jgi:folate-dependent phosphoribosylglycinamide formyltransferase PurN
VGVVAIAERKQRGLKRIRRELKRTGPLRFLDVLGFRLYYKLFVGARDRRWQDDELDKLRAVYSDKPTAPVMVTHSPNSAEAAQFIKSVAPDIVIARCKVLLKEEIFSIPTTGTFVMHPGVCPEYRNAHGCFWALANDDAKNVGMTLLRVDKGVDTGPIYGYYSYEFDELKESHFVIQNRVVIDNLNQLEQKLNQIHRGEAQTIDTNGRPSSTWGQPWLSKYLQLKRRAKRRRNL